MTLAARSVLAALVLTVPVAAQLIWPSLEDDGHAVFAASQLLGWLLVATVVRAAAARHATVRTTRAGRVGSRVLLAGCALQVLFAAVYGTTAVVSGEPAEASFVLFLLGFLSIFVGGLAWGRALLRTPETGLAGVGALATAVLGFLAVAVGADPLHDVFLLSSYAAWVVVGRGLDTRPAVTAEVSAASR